MRKIVYKHDNVVQLFAYSEELENKILWSFSSHMGKVNIASPCANCGNCYVTKCLKVADDAYRDIEDYPFITCGYMICEDDGSISKITVEKCDNYINDRPTKEVDYVILNEPRIKQFISICEEMEKGKTYIKR